MGGMIPSPPAHSTRRVENNPDEAEHFVTMLRESPGQVDFDRGFPTKGAIAGNDHPIAR